MAMVEADKSQEAAAEALALSDRNAQGDSLAMSLVEAGTNLKFATLSLVSCHSTTAPSIKEFVDLRSSVTADANLYRSAVLPVAKMSLQKVKEFMDYFMDLEFEDVLTVIDDIVEEARRNQDLMLLNRETHMAVAAKFEKKNAMVDRVLAKCALEAEAQKEKEEKHRASASTKHNWAFALSFVPLVGLIASPLLAQSASGNIDEAVAASKEAEMAVAASKVVKETLQVAIYKYAESMKRCADEFGKIARDCEAMGDKGEQVAEKKKEAFYELMRKRGEVILDAVKTFDTTCVSAEVDLMILPRDEQPNYVHEWLAERRDGTPSFKDRIRNLLPKAVREVAALKD